MTNPLSVVPVGAITVSINTTNCRESTLLICDIGATLSMVPGLSYDLGTTFSQQQISNSIQLKQNILAGYLTAQAGTGTTPD